MFSIIFGGSGEIFHVFSVVLQTRNFLVPSTKVLSNFFLQKVCPYTVLLKNAKDITLLKNIISKADILIQNLAPGAFERLGLDLKKLRNKALLLIGFAGGFRRNEQTGHPQGGHQTR